MFKALLLIVFWALLSIPDRNSQPLTSQSDSTQIEITPHLDSAGLLDGYQVYINTPICEVEQCYKVQLNLYCDAIGNFVSYDTLKGHELTKLDHIPFTTEDYLRLQHILTDHHSVLSSYQKEELVKNTRSSEIEGFTGATVLEIKRNVIEGAVYSCHTLWHITHGPLADSLKILTASNLDQAMVRKLVSRKDQQINYFLIDYCSKQQYQQYLPEILSTLKDSQGYYAKNALEKIPAEVLNREDAQEFFAAQFSQLDYFAQIALLKKLERDLLTAELKSVLLERLDQRSSLRNELIQELTAATSKSP